jgi:hypothetical protein
MELGRFTAGTGCQQAQKGWQRFIILHHEARSNEARRGLVVQFAQKQPHPLSFRSQVDRRGIYLLPAAKQQIPRATMPRFGMTNLWGFSNYTTKTRGW